MAKRISDLHTHIDEWCIARDLPYRYADFVRWIEQGDEFGEKVPVRKLQRVFKARPETIRTWKRKYKESLHNPVDK